MQIKDEGALTFPGKLRSDPTKRLRNKYCRFHRDHGHDTANYYDLKQQIEAFIREGKLQKFVKRKGRMRILGNRPLDGRTTIQGPLLGT